MKARVNVVYLTMTVNLMVSPAIAQTLTTLHNFTGGSDGTYPYGPVVVGDGGVLYGTTQSGGEKNRGTVFAVTPPAAAGGEWTETVLYSFQAGTDGAIPNAPLTIGKGGALYGTTSLGGANDLGAVFEVAPPQAVGGKWTERVIYSFGHDAGGSMPNGGLTAGAAGVLYGTTGSDGISNCGTVFQLLPPISPTGFWTMTAIYSFAGSSDGCTPLAGVVTGAEGVLYGTTYAGGTSNLGTVFSLTPPAGTDSNWRESLLYSFSGIDGSGPATGVIVSPGGLLYGTTGYGGSADGGTIYSLTPPATLSGSWTERVMVDFQTDTPHGPGPWPATPVLGAGGTVYDTTGSGGAPEQGTAFALKLTSPGGLWQEILLHTFTPGQGFHPNGLTIGGRGVLYGTTWYGGPFGYGTVFALTE